MDAELAVALTLLGILVCGIVAIVVYLARKVDRVTGRIAQWLATHWQSWQIRRDERKRRRTESLVSRHVDLATMAVQAACDKDHEIADLRAQLAALRPVTAAAIQGVVANAVAVPQPPPQTLALQDALHALNVRLGAMDERLKTIELARLAEPPRRRKGLDAALPPGPQKP